MSKRPQNLGSSVDKIKEELWSASITSSCAWSSYLIWWTLSDPARTPRQNRIKIGYDGFFKFTQDAHRRNMIVQLDVLVDTTQNTSSLPHILKRIEKEGVDCDAERKAYSALSGTIKKIKIIRNNVYAHRNADTDMNTWFARAGLSQNEIGSLSIDIHGIINQLLCKLGMEEEPLHPDVRRDTLAVLDLLPLNRPLTNLFEEGS